MAAANEFPWLAKSQMREPRYADDADTDADNSNSSTRAVSAPAERPEQPIKHTSSLTSTPPTKKVNIVLPQEPRTNNVSATRDGRHSSSSSDSNSRASTDTGEEGAMHLPHLHHHTSDGQQEAQQQQEKQEKQHDEEVPVSQGEEIPRAGATHMRVRTIPPWVRDAEQSDVESIDEQQQGPAAAFVAQHNYLPATERPLLGGSGVGTWNGGAVNGQAGLKARPHNEHTSRWLSFARPSAYPSETASWDIASQEWWEANDPDYSKEWLQGRYAGDDGEGGDDGYQHKFRTRQQVWYIRVQGIILRNPFVPLGLRLAIIAFSCAALALGAIIYRDSGQILDCLRETAGSRSAYCVSRVGNKSITYYRDPSGLMAVIVDTVAVVYNFYMTYDEYFSKPLGLRPARQKVRLVLLDLFFIIFQSANLALSFSALSLDEGSCTEGKEPSTLYHFFRLCERQRGLSAVLLVSLVAWLLTFAVSILRLVERIDRR